MFECGAETKGRGQVQEKKGWNKKESSGREKRNSSDFYGMTRVLGRLVKQQIPDVLLSRNNMLIILRTVLHMW